MPSIRWNPHIFDLSPGLKALDDAVESRNAASFKRKEMERQRERDRAADEYNRAQMDNLAADNARADRDEQERRKRETREATQRMIAFLRGGQTAEANAEAGAMGGTLEQGKRAEMPKLRLDEPTMEPADEEPRPTLGLGALFGSKPQKPPGLAGMLKLDPGYEQPDDKTQAKIGDWREGVQKFDDATDDPMNRGGFKYRGPDGRELVIDPDEQRTAEEARKETEGKRQADYLRTAADQADAGGDTDTARSLRAEAIRLEATLPGASAQHLRSRELQQAGQGFESDQNETYRLTAQDQKDIALARSRRVGTGGGGKNLKTRKDEADLTNKQLTTEGKYTGEVQKVLQNYGFKDLNTQAVKLGDLASQVAGATDNAAFNAIARGSFVKMSQGGTGVISDADLRVFWERIGGLGMRASEAWRGYVDGTLDPAKRKIVESAVREMEARARANMDQIGGAITTRLEVLPGGKERIPSYLKTYSPGYFEKWQAGQANAGQGAAADAVEAEADARLQRLRGGKR